MSGSQKSEVEALLVDKKDGGSTTAKPSTTPVASSSLQHMRDVARWPSSMSLPENIYGAAMMASFRSAHDKDFITKGLLIILWLALIMNILIQGYILEETRKYITKPAVLHAQSVYAGFENVAIGPDGKPFLDWEKRLGDDQAEELCQMPLSQPFFCFAIMVTWTATCFVDLKESWLYISHLWALPTTADQITVNDDEEEALVVTGLSRFVKVWVMTNVFMPKVFIASFLWWMGARWLLATMSFSDLMLSAVALAFITELDELVYAAIVPEDIQTMVQGYKLHRAESEELNAAASSNNFAQVTLLRDRRFRNRVVEMFLSFVLILAVPAIYMRFLQRALPNYHWDVHDPCEAWVAKLLEP